MSAPATRRYRMYRGGGWVDAGSGARFDSVDPYAGRAWATVPDASADDVDLAVAAAREAFDHGPWPRWTGAQRAAALRRLAELLARDARALAEIESRDNGKLLREMRGQMDYLPAWFHYFAGLADKLHGQSLPTDRTNLFAYTRREPGGVVAAIVPWNSPLLLLGWKLAPGLAAGCTFVVRPSEHTPASALELAARADEAGLPPGVLNVVTSSGPDAARRLVAHPEVDRIAFTGSTEVGVEIARTAATHLTRTVLELGGKSAQVVLADADLGAAANGIVAGVFAASGQTCMAGGRLIAERSISSELVGRVVERAERIVLGDPAAPGTEMGPLANERQLRRVRTLVQDAIDRGARLATGGIETPAGGLFFPPTVLCDVPSDARVLREEVFGPVLVVVDVEDPDAAIRAANDTRFGLAASVWTRDVHAAHRVAHALRAGTVWINAFRVVSPDVPFGGMGSSGWGRESGIAAIDEYTETKAVWVELSGETRDPFVLG